MSNSDPTEIASKPSQGRPVSRSMGHPRSVALLALVVGATGSLVFMFRAGEHTPRLLLFFFIIWVLSPFVALLWAGIVSKRWSALTQVALHGVTMIVTLATLAIYGQLVDVKPAGSANAFLFVAVPPVSLLFMVIVVTTAALISGRLSRRRDGS